MTWRNWYQHVSWLSVFFIIIVPLMGFVAAYFHPLQRATAIFAVVYYFNTGLGITAGGSNGDHAGEKKKNANSHQDTTVSGPTPPTEHPPPSRYT